MRIDLKELLFPRRCPVCDRVLVYGSYICKECKGKLIKIKEPRCFKCGKSIKNASEEYCYDCSSKQHIYDQGLSLYEYKSVSNSIYRFKYSKRAEYGHYFGMELAKAFRDNLREWKVDGIIAVPVHKKKLNKRGFNQAAVLAKALSKSLNIPFYPEYVKRKKNTVALKELNPEERQINLKNAFIIGTNDVKLSRIVIVDDIYTTGSTIDEIARLLKANNVEKVYFLTLSSGAGL